MAREKSPYILNTNSNLLGLCLIVMTSLKIADRTEAGFIDEMTGVASLLLMISCLLSFLSMRTRHVDRGERLETWADYIFVCGLVCVFCTIALISFQFLL